MAEIWQLKRYIVSGCMATVILHHCRQGFACMLRGAKKLFAERHGGLALVMSQSPWIQYLWIF